MPQSTAAVVEVDEELWFGTVGDDKELEERASQSMAAVAARVLGAKPFPAAARKLEELTRDVGTKIEQVVGVLESDPGLSMRLLRLVNSAGYALRVRCTSVRHAASLVGMRRLHQLATTAAVLDLFETDNPAIKSLLGHAAVVGAFCRYLAVHVDLPPDELFTCGFLHDIGKLMMIDAEGEPYLDLVRQAGEKPDALHLLEQQHFGFDHAVLGAHVLKNWRIPNPVPRVVAWHHNTARAYQADPHTASMVQTLRLADQLSYLVRTNPGEDGIMLAAQSPAAGYLGISEAQLSSMWGDLTRLSQRIHATPGTDQAELIPRADSVPPSMRPRKKKGGKSLTPVRSLPPGTFSAPPGFASEPSYMPSVLPALTATVSELPKAFGCVVCNKASYGNRCPVCSGHVCAQHQVGPEQWCTDCAKAYRLDVGSQGFPLWERLTALGIVVGAGLLSMLVAVLAGRPVLGALVGSTLLAGMGVTLVLIGRRFLMKRSFLRKRGHVVEADETALPLGLSMPPEPAIAVRDDLAVRPTVLAHGDLPALFSVAPVASESMGPSSVAFAPPPPSVAPSASLSPPDSVAPPPSIAPAAALPTRTIPITRAEAAPAEVPAPEAPPFAPSLPWSERFSSPAPAHTLIGLQPSALPLEPAPTVPARRRPAHGPAAPAVPAVTAAVPDASPAAAPTLHAASYSELPEAPGWRPVERTEPASPNSKLPAELKRLSEAVPPLPPAPVLPAIEEPPPSVVESEPPAPAPSPTLASAPSDPEPAPREDSSHTDSLRMEAPDDAVMSEAAPSMNSPVASLRPESLRSALAAPLPVEAPPASSAPDSAPQASDTPSDRLLPPPEDSGIFVAAACQAVAPSMLVACRPASLKPTHYACSRLAP